jgi:hypothetical protein
MSRSSNRDRIGRAAEEARLTKVEKEAQKAEKQKAAALAPKASRAKRVVAPARVKIVWEVCTPNEAVVAVYSYPDKPAAEARTAELTKSTGRMHTLRGTKVPME